MAQTLAQPLGFDDEYPDGQWDYYRYYTGHFDPAVEDVLSAIVEAPELVADFFSLSRMGRPAVQAVAVEAGQVIDALATKQEKDAASQFCGWSVGRVMRGLGHRVVRERGRVVGAPFKTGAVWEPIEAGVSIVRSLPAGCTRRIELSVRAEKDGRIVGQWEAVQSASDPVRRIRTVVQLARPVP